MKRGKPSQGLGPEKVKIKTALDIGCASDGRGLNKKLMVGCNGQYTPTCSLYTIEMLIWD